MISWHCNADRQRREQDKATSAELDSLSGAEQALELTGDIDEGLCLQVHSSALLALVYLFILADVMPGRAPGG